MRGLECCVQQTGQRRSATDDAADYPAAGAPAAAAAGAAGYYSHTCWTGGRLAEWEVAFQQQPGVGHMLQLRSLLPVWGTQDPARIRVQ